jgi:hypothetical protein
VSFGAWPNDPGLPQSGGGGSGNGTSPLVAQPGASHYFQPEVDVTVATFTNQRAYAQPFYLPVAQELLAMFIDVSTAGDGASTFTPAVWADDGAGYPGALLATTVAALSTAAIAMVSGLVTPNVALPAALLWIGGLELAPTTSPQLRAANWAQYALGATALPIANAQGSQSWAVAGVSALPNPWPVQAGNAIAVANPPRVGMQLT